MGLQQHLVDETVSRLPLREAITVQPATVVRAAIAKMRSAGLGCAVIVDLAGKPQGIFTERSVIGALIKDKCLDECAVSEFTDPDFLVVKSSEPISTVWDTIRHKGLRFICVTDDDGNLIGLTGQRGMAEYVSEFFPQQVMVQRLGSKPWLQEREGA